MRLALLTSLLFFVLSTARTAAQTIALRQAPAPLEDSSVPARTPASTQATTPAEALVLTYAEQMPVFTGGEAALHQYLKRMIKFPAEALARRLSGTVVVQFVVDEQGRVLDPTVVRSSQTIFDDEALRLARLMPWWQPGRHQGSPARVRSTLPIIFTAR